MSRRRGQREEEREEFLDANPELRTYETQFRVVEVEREENEPGQKHGGHKGPRYEVEVTLDGEELDSYVQNIKGDRGVTQVLSVESEGGNLRPGFQFDPDDGPQQPLVKELNALSLSENGFGVSQPSGKGMDGPGGRRGRDEDREPPSTEDFALDGDETLVFNAPRINSESSSNKEEDGPRDLGAIEFGIDYTVLGGRGTIEILLIDQQGQQKNFEYMEPTSGASGPLRTGDEGSFDLEMEEGTFETAHVRVTGSLEVAIVGIDITSNTNDFSPLTI